MLEKKALSPEVLEAQTALELPDREMMLIVIGTITVNLEDVNVCGNAVVVGQDVQKTCDQR